MKGLLHICPNRHDMKGAGMPYSKGQNSSVMIPGQLAMAWSRIVLAVCVIIPMWHSATPFCQWPPTVQNDKSCWSWLQDAWKSVDPYTPLSALIVFMRTLYLAANSWNSCLDLTNNLLPGFRGKLDKCSVRNGRSISYNICISLESEGHVLLGFARATCFQLIGTDASARRIVWGCYYTGVCLMCLAMSFAILTCSADWVWSISNCRVHMMKMIMVNPLRK